MTDNAQGFAALEDMIERVRSLPDIAREAAPMVARELESEISKAIAQQRSPEGVAWAPTSDGHAPLQNAMSVIEVVAVGTDVIATLSGFHIFHQRGGQGRHARAAERAAGTARKQAKAAAKYVRRTARVGTVSKKAQEKADTTAAAATDATAHHAEVKLHGGLPARPMIPTSLPGEFGRAIKEIYKQRFDEKMAVAS